MVSREPQLSKQSFTPDWELEAQLWRSGYSPVAGIDEAGRGALAGPVVAAAVILPLGEYPFRDSKTLSVEARADLAGEVKRSALAWAVGLASAQEVDRLNVLQATHLAAKRALSALALSPSALVTDYLWLDVPHPVTAVAKGDSRSLQIAAASILAKTHRDALMQAYANDYPAYSFEKNKGYGAPVHLNALDLHGPCTIHRRSFRPVSQRRLFSVEVD